MSGLRFGFLVSLGLAASVSLAACGAGAGGGSGAANGSSSGAASAPSASSSAQNTGGGGGGGAAPAPAKGGFSGGTCGKAGAVQSSFQIIDITNCLNLVGIEEEGKALANGGTDAFDYGCCSIAAAQMPKPGVWVSKSDGGSSSEQVPFLIPVYGVDHPGVLTLNTLGSDANVQVPAGSYKTLWLLDAGVNGDQSGQITVMYADGSKDALSTTYSDWCHNTTTDPEDGLVIHPDHRMNSDGTDTTPDCGLLRAHYKLNASKQVKSLDIPQTSNVNIQAITVEK